MKYLLIFALFFTACNTSNKIDSSRHEMSSKNVKITPIFHGSLVIQHDGKTLYIDPYDSAERFSAFPNPDLVLITHPHGDHLNKKTLGGLDLSETILIAPKVVAEDLGEINFGEVKVLANGANYEWEGIKVEAVPMYNLPETSDSRHPKGWGNGYVINVGGERIYVSGDTEDIAEMRALKNIDRAFVCMNLPYTMTIDQAADAVLEFKPKTVYPYHFRGKDGFSDVEAFKAIVNKGDSDIKVEMLEWYAEK